MGPGKGMPMTTECNCNYRKYYVFVSIVFILMCTPTSVHKLVGKRRMHGGYAYRSIRSGDAGKLGKSPILSVTESVLPDKFARFLYACHDFRIRSFDLRTSTFRPFHMIEVIFMFTMCFMRFEYCSYFHTVATDVGSKSFD